MEKSFTARFQPARLEPIRCRLCDERLERGRGLGQALTLIQMHMLGSHPVEFGLANEWAEEKLREERRPSLEGSNELSCPPVSPPPLPTAP